MINFVPRSGTRVWIAGNSMPDPGMVACGLGIILAAAMFGLLMELTESNEGNDK